MFARSRANILPLAALAAGMNTVTASRKNGIDDGVVKGVQPKSGLLTK